MSLFFLSRRSPRAKEVVTPISESSYCRHDDLRCAVGAGAKRHRQGRRIRCTWPAGKRWPSGRAARGRQGHARDVPRPMRAASCHGGHCSGSRLTPQDGSSGTPRRPGRATVTSPEAVRWRVAATSAAPVCRDRTRSCEQYVLFCPNYSCN